MLVHDMPTHILTLPRTVITPQTPHALPPRPPPTQRARPPSSTHASLFEGATRATVECDEGGDYHGDCRAEPAAAYGRGGQLPCWVGATQGREDVGGHGIEPIVFRHDVAVGTCTSVPTVGSARRRWQSVLRPARFAIESVLGVGMTGTATPLFDAEVVDEGHAAGAVAGREEGIFGGRVVDDEGREGL
mmetsp:Transcript_23065/g.41172  ORF Transcript_23065/g.41172 Transcript_23065/m.41172 type:complete len:189 (-) Transcript_23065:796-1362(-)